MKAFTDTGYLRKVQYGTSANLDRRSGLHERFSTNPYGWHRWVFDRLDLPGDAKVLEMGCGPAYLWQENAARIPAGWTVTLTDFSRGMIAAAREGTGSGPGRFRFTCSDAMAIPFPDAAFDAVIANHMLYHVPDRQEAFREIGRVLRERCRLYAATNGHTHLKELFDLANEFDSDRTADGRGGANFGLQNGRQQLEEHFDDITLERYEDGLVITELDGLIGWAASWAPDIYDRDRLNDFYALLTDRFHARKPFRVTKDPGLFTARKR